MKKEYIKPEIEIIMIDVEQPILTTSGQGDDEGAQADFDGEAVDAFA